MTLTEWFRRVRARRVPLAAVVSLDPSATERMLRIACNEMRTKGYSDLKHVWRWDCHTGLQSMTEDSEILPCGMPHVMLDVARQLPESSVVLAQHIDAFLAEGRDRSETLQGLANLREVYERQGSTLVMIGYSVGSGLGGMTPDIMVHEEQLPSASEYAVDIKALYKTSGLELPEDLGPMTDALGGLSRFAARQQVALSLTSKGMDYQALWEHKRQLINRIPGLTFFAAEKLPGYGQVGGCQAIKDYGQAIMGGRLKPRVIVWLDEIEKALAGATGDTSGVSQDFLGTLLTHLQDTQAQGMVFLGPPGTSKSYMVQALAGEHSVPCIRLDLGACKGSLVGESEAKLRHAIKVIEALADGQALWIATSNSLAVIPSALRRRLSDVFFFDLPDEQERLSIWSIYRHKYELASESLPDDSQWTGAEIALCSRKAWALNKSLIEASKTIVPVARQAREEIERLRNEADGRYLSAAYEGVYVTSKETGRALTLD